jgi:cephalosporin hydroxylase
MIHIDLKKRQVSFEDNEKHEVYGLATPEAFKIISDAWLQAGWDNKYVYSFTWFGRPVIQLPDDMLRIQEIIYTVQPDVIIETGIAHGGSLIFYASLCRALGKGRVVGVDIEIRPHNRQAIESHFLYPLITLIEGSSIDPKIVQKVGEHVLPGEKVLVILDSCHNKDHVFQELEKYAPFVSLNSYIVATDGIMEKLVDAPRSQSDWSWNNPRQAALEFAKKNTNFVLEEPKFMFNEGNITERVTYWPDCFLKRIV